MGMNFKIKPSYIRCEIKNKLYEKGIDFCTWADLFFFKC